MVQPLPGVRGVLGSGSGSGVKPDCDASVGVDTVPSLSHALLQVLPVSVFSSVLGFHVSDSFRYQSRYALLCSHLAISPAFAMVCASPRTLSSAFAHTSLCCCSDCPCFLRSRCPRNALLALCNPSSTYYQKPPSCRSGRLKEGLTSVPDSWKYTLSLVLHNASVMSCSFVITTASH